MNSLLLATPPGLLIIIGALLLPALPRAARKPWLVLLPLISLAHALSLPMGQTASLRLFDLELTPLRVDALALLFGLSFHVAAVACALFATEEDDDVQHVAGLVFAGAAIMAVYAGDLASLFVAWSLTGISSAFLIFAGRTEHSLKAGMRYLLLQVGSGVLLLDGVLDHIAVGGSLAFTRASLLGAEAAATGVDLWSLHAGTKYILLAIAIKAAFPLLHSWLNDSVPASTASGGAFLAAFSTKLGVYALLRAFGGVEALVALGMVMALVPLLYAFAENDLRRAAAWLINSQLGVMVLGVGLGTTMALNGVAAFAAAMVLAETLLLISLGALLLRTGTARASELGALHHHMPLTAGAALFAGLAMAGFPGLAGFTTRPLIVEASASDPHVLPWLVLSVAGVGAISVGLLRIPYAAFYAPRPPCDTLALPERDAGPATMAAMALLILGCVAIGALPGGLYGLLPFPMEQAYPRYTPDHGVTQLQTIAFTTLAFVLMGRRGLLQRAPRGLLLDTDWLYVKLIPQGVRWAVGRYMLARDAVIAWVELRVDRTMARLYRTHGPEGALARTWPTGATAMWAAALLGVYLVVYYL